MKRLLRVGVALLAVIEVVLGFWTAFFPESFYALPTLDLTPPFSEHLMRDFGGATLGLAVVLIAATIWPETKLVIVALAAYLAFSVPHFVFHVLHVDGATALQATILLTLLGFAVVLPALLIVVAVRVSRPPARRRD